MQRTLIKTIRYYCIVISADVCCTFPLQCYLCWRMLYVSIAMLSQLTYAVRYYCIVISADVCCTLLLHCYLSWHMLYVTIALLSQLTYAVRYYCTVISAAVCYTLPSKDIKFLSLLTRGERHFRYRIFFDSECCRLLYLQWDYRGPKYRHTRAGDLRAAFSAHSGIGKTSTRFRTVCCAGLFCKVSQDAV